MPLIPDLKYLDSNGVLVSAETVEEALSYIRIGLYVNAGVGLQFWLWVGEEDPVDLLNTISSQLPKQIAPEVIWPSAAYLVLKEKLKTGIITPLEQTEFLQMTFTQGDL